MVVNILILCPLYLLQVLSPEMLLLLFTFTGDTFGYTHLCSVDDLALALPDCEPVGGGGREHLHPALFGARGGIKHVGTSRSSFPKVSNEQWFFKKGPAWLPYSALTSSVDECVI